MTRLINRNTDPSLMWGFLVAIAFTAIYAVVYAILTKPLYRFLSIPGQPLASSVIHIILIALVGSAVCCLTYLLPNRRIPLLGYGWLAFFFVLLLILATVHFDGEERNNLFAILFGFGLGPVLVGNGLAWGIYIRRREEKTS